MRFTLATLIVVLAYIAVVFASLRQANVYWNRSLEVVSYTAFATAILISIRWHRHTQFFAFGSFGLMLAFGPYAPVELIANLATAMEIPPSRSVHLDLIVTSHVSILGAFFGMIGTLTYVSIPMRHRENESTTRLFVGLTSAFLAYLAIAYFSFRHANLFWEVAIDYGVYVTYSTAAVIGVIEKDRGLAFIAFALFGSVFDFGWFVPYEAVAFVSDYLGHNTGSALQSLEVILNSLVALFFAGLAFLVTHAVANRIDHRLESKP